MDILYMILIFLAMLFGSEALDFKQVPCTEESNKRRTELTEEAKCGPPNELFIILKPKVAHEEVYPGGVWVKRCLGLCQHQGKSKCVNTATVLRKIPIRIYNVLTNKEICSTYPVEEDISCDCYDGGCGEPPDDFVKQ